MDATILKAIHAATGIRFDEEKVPKDKLRLPGRLKCGGVMSMVDLRNPAFLGAILDVLPRCIDRTGPSGEKTRGVYNATLTEVIGEGAYDQEGHRNARFLQATTVGPFPKALQFAWQFTRLDCAHNRGVNLESAAEDWGRLGPLATDTLTDFRNREAAERKRRGVPTTEMARGNNDGNEAQMSTHDMAEAMAATIEELEGEGEPADASKAANDERASHEGARAEQENVG